MYCIGMHPSCSVGILLARLGIQHSLRTISSITQLRVLVFAGSLWALPAQVCLLLPGKSQKKALQEEVLYIVLLLAAACLHVKTV